MAMRFRKSMKIGPVRFTASKSGISTSVGVKGFRVTKTASGRVRTTTSIPGTGISYVSESSNKKSTRSRSATTRSTGSGSRQSPIAKFLKIIFGIIFIIAGFASPEGGWSFSYFITAFLIGAALICWAILPALKARKQPRADTTANESSSISSDRDQ